MFIAKPKFSGEIGATWMDIMFALLEKNLRHVVVPIIKQGEKMKRLKIIFASLAAALVFSGCAGTNFVRPDSGTFALGKSTSAEVAQKMGNPLQNGEMTKNEKLIKVAKYAYAEGAGQGTYPGVVPARAITFSFFEDKLVGQEFMSSFKTDSTDFDGTKIPGIVKGKSTRNDVTALLGKPTGEAIYPMIKSKDDSALIYGYSQAKGSVFDMKFHNKVLVVSFNGQGIVTDVEYVSSGDK